MLAFALPAGLALGCAVPSQAIPTASEGQLDLRNWDFQRDGEVRLIGSWDFFPGLLLSGEQALEASKAMARRVPDHWTEGLGGAARGTGAGTYRLKILLPATRPRLGIRYTTLSTAFELDADGALIASAGRPALSPSAEIPAYRPGVARLPQEADSLVLVVRDSNYRYRIGGMWRPFFLGEIGALERRSWEGETGSLALAASLAVLAVIFAFFIRGGIEGRSFVYFCLFSLVAGLRVIVTGEYAIVRLIPSIDFDILIRLEYLSVYSLFPLGLLLISSLFPTDHASVGIKALLAICAFSLLLVFLAPLRVLTWSIRAYYVVAAAVIATTGWITVRAVTRKRVGGPALLIGASALALAGVNDALYSSFVLDSGNFLSYGMLGFIGAQAYALARRHRWTQGQLRKALAEKELLIKEVHHRVKNSLQIVSSIASLQSHRVEHPAALAAYASMQGRIRAISLVHEKLYALESSEMVDVGAYARELAALLAESYGIEGEEAPVVDAESVAVPADLCIDLGLMMTELVSNSYKHAVGPAIAARS